MERRRFILLSVAGTATVALPALQCNIANDIYKPEFLQSIVGNTKVKEIGKAYVDRFNTTANKKQLVELIDSSINEQPASQINLIIADEFRRGKIVIVNGWLLSVTEARQSALFYLNS